MPIPVAAKRADRQKFVVIWDISCLKVELAASVTSSVMHNSILCNNSSLIDYVLHSAQVRVDGAICMDGLCICSIYR